MMATSTVASLAQKQAARRDVAETLARRLELGLSNVAESVAWAEDEIARDPKPHWTLCEVATAGTKDAQDVVSLLREIPGTADPAVVQDLMYSLMMTQLAGGPAAARQVVSALYQLALAEEIENPDVRRMAWWADDAWDLAETGSITETVDDVISEVSGVLQKAVRTS